MDYKICTKCKEHKDISEFARDMTKKSGIRSACKACVRNNSKNYYIKNREKEIKRCSEYNKKNKEKHAKHNRDYYKNNKAACLKRSSAYEKRKMKSDPIYRLKRILRDRFRKALKNDYKNGSAVTDLGCSIEEFKKYLESKFQPGMSWDKFHNGEIHLDHIKPLCIFNLQDEKQLKEALNYKNLQPLWKLDNLVKGSKYE